MANYRLNIAYDGGNYYGFQKNANHPTIEGSLTNVLEKILQHPITVQGASRTDKGVHAKNQVGNFFSEKTFDLGKLQSSMNRLLPPDIRVLELKHVEEEFHPSLDAEKKQYLYQVCTRKILFPHERFFYWHYPKKTIQDIKSCLKIFEGEKDFSAFSTEKPENPICKLFAITLEEDGPLLHIRVTGDRFLYKMVRGLVGTILAFASGDLSQEELSHLFIEKKRKKAGVSAPAHGLFLEKIYYRKRNKNEIGQKL